jgi:methionyl-tRNA formyltransferase
MEVGESACAEAAAKTEFFIKPEDSMAADLTQGGVLSSTGMRILVVSDNPRMISWLQSEIVPILSSWDVQTDVCCSAGSEARQGLVHLGVTPINLSDTDVQTKVFESYLLLLSVHCNQIFPESLVERSYCVNLHPGFNPFNRGWYPHVFSMINGLKAGATLHRMDKYLDHGPIIDQIEVEIQQFETSAEVYERILEAEKVLLRRNLQDLVSGAGRSRDPSTAGNLNSRKDFARLCKLDLEHVGTLRQHLDLLRALTHGDLFNAWFEVNERRFQVGVRIREVEAGEPN